MLVLSRKVGESVLVPQYGFAVTVLVVKGDVIRLGFSAPTEVGIYREEVWERRCREDVAEPERE